ncbi:unnamed protein product [Microthlaspi erraticum]|uniref:F-box domain-containing protein n=2 Tax=Microthlaspi erraticum TaxID=1685480 RepID=A0A6D2KTZ0_9BRAS|nr:unnamed protein product [Microthlaspi erraticum]
MINQLPDCLLCEILFHLPTEDVVRTSLVCRRWRNLWQDVPGLDLEIDGFAKYEFFNRFMDLNSGLRLQIVKLRYHRCIGYNYVKPTLNTVFKQKIQRLDVESNRRCELVEIPPTIYTSCLEMLISACPALETLTMDKMYIPKVSSQSLLSFSLTTHEENEYPRTQVLMQTPGLKYLKLKRHFIARIIIDDLSSIVTLDLDDLTNFGESFPNFLTLISCVRNLTISVDILEVIRRFSKSESLRRFHNLSTLSVKGMKFGSWESLLVLLESCPNLKSLFMGFRIGSYGRDFLYVPHCVLSSLEFVEVKAKHLANMEKLGSFFLQNSTVLRKLTLCLDHIKEQDSVILAQLIALPRRSNTCEVVARSRT